MIDDAEYANAFSDGYRFALIEVEYHLRKEKFDPESMRRVQEVFKYLKGEEKS